MAFISNEVTLHYKGDDYIIPMSMGLVNRIESAGVNLFQLQIDLESGGIPPLSLIATAFSVMLQASGAKVTPDEVWEEINHGETVEVIQAARMAVMACFPKAKERKSGKKKAGKQ
jgi:hypothetical protein